MNILFDLISTQGFINGGAEYTIRVFEELQKELQNKDNSEKIIITGLIDSLQKYVYNDYKPEVLSNRFDNIEFVDIQSNKLETIIRDKLIDCFFIGIGQRFIEYDLSNITCPTIMVLHDSSYLEDREDQLTFYTRIQKEKKTFLKLFVDSFRHLYHDTRNKMSGTYTKNRQKEILFSQAIKDNNNIQIITVSEYSKLSLSVFYSLDETKIKVLYSPEKFTFTKEVVECSILKDIITKGIKYLLIVSADRDLKNAKKALKAFDIYTKQFKTDLYIVTIGLSQKIYDRHIILPYLSSSDLEHAYRNCYALFYPSLFEGFGYPPIEAMKYGKPVLASNVTSIPEILGNAPAYFSPFYTIDILKAIRNFETNYTLLCERSRSQYSYLSHKQNQDLEELIRLILDK